MKIAVATDNGKTISKHLGRAPHYLVYTVDGTEIVGKAWREKPGHGTPEHEGHDHHAGGVERGTGTYSEINHIQMMEVIQDCDAIIVAAVICGAYLEMKENNIQPYVTNVDDVEQAIRNWLDGQLVDYAEWLH